MNILLLMRRGRSEEPDGDNSDSNASGLKDHERLQLRGCKDLERYPPSIGSSTKIGMELRGLQPMNNRSQITMSHKVRFKLS